MPTYRLLMALACLQVPVALADDAQDTAAHRQVVIKDLFAVITLSGQHCGKVVDYEVMPDGYYMATCANGARYRVGVTPAGRVQVGEHEQ